MLSDGFVIGLDLLENVDREILFAAKITFDARHVVHDQQILALVMEISRGLPREMPVAAKGARLSHLVLSSLPWVLELRRRGHVNSDNDEHLTKDTTNDMDRFA